jgi:hypothetical protein
VFNQALVADVNAGVTNAELESPRQGDYDLARRVMSPATKLGKVS